MKDPNFPNRPDHDDFWKLSQAVIDNDAAAEQLGIEYQDIVGQHVDFDSLFYMARQRCLRIDGTLDPAKIAAWMDGFMAAVSAEEIPTVFDGQRRERKS